MIALSHEPSQGFAPDNDEQHRDYSRVREQLKPNVV
jgi:hypothetical protein